MTSDPSELEQRENNITLFKEGMQPLFDQLTHIAMLGTGGKLEELPEFIENPHKFFERLVSDEKSVVRGALLLAALDGALRGDGRQRTVWAALAKDLIRDKEKSAIDKEKIELARTKPVKGRDLREVKEVPHELISEMDEDGEKTKKTRS
jgi:hypothetical protein